jgi:hypothetical protein
MTLLVLNVLDYHIQQSAITDKPNMVYDAQKVKYQK